MKFPWRHASPFIAAFSRIIFPGRGPPPTHHGQSSGRQGAQLQQQQIKPIQQNPTLATYANKIDKEHARIDWLQPAIQIERTVRAYNPSPVAYTFFNGERIKIWQARALSDQQSTAEPGTILESNETGLAIATGQGILLIEQAQFPGKKPLEIKAILNSKPSLFTQGAKFDEQ